jgi:hypothetical protein
MDNIEEEELDAWRGHLPFYVTELLNGETSLDEFKDSLLSFRNSEFYTGTQ